MIDDSGNDNNYVACDFGSPLGNRNRHDGTYDDLVCRRSTYCIFAFAFYRHRLWSQIAVFFVVSIVLLIFTRPLALKYMNKGVEKTNVDSIPGQKGIVTQTIDNLKAEGKVTIQGMEWSARSKDESVIEEGKVVKVAAVEGVKLIVEEEM